MSLTTSSESAVICVPAPTSADVTDPKLLYVTTDGINWREASTPDDMSKSLDLQVVRIPSGYMALGEARLGDQSTLEYWASGDGFTWSRISPTLPNGQTLDMGIYLGLLGSDSLGLHSSDGVSWTLDEDQAPLWTSGSFRSRPSRTGGTSWLPMAGTPPSTSALATVTGACSIRVATSAACPAAARRGCFRMASYTPVAVGSSSGKRHPSGRTGIASAPRARSPPPPTPQRLLRLHDPVFGDSSANEPAHVDADRIVTNPVLRSVRSRR